MSVLQFPTKPEPARASVNQSAALLKSTLRKAFPAVKFSVRTGRGTAYGHCYVSWTDGPTPRRVDAIVGQFEGKGFDGSTDSTTYKKAIMPNGERSGLGMILTQRATSAAFARRLAQAVSAFWGGEDMRAPEVIDNGRHWYIDPTDNMASVSRTGEYWQTLIHRASSDRTRVIRSGA